MPSKKILKKKPSKKMSGKKMKKRAHKGGKVEGPVRHFRIAILDNKEIHRSEKGLGAAEATISMKANPVDAAKTFGINLQTPRIKENEQT
jgi:hypothetical protein